jgi:hypothetical protein
MVFSSKSWERSTQVPLGKSGDFCCVVQEKKAIRLNRRIDRVVFGFILGEIKFIIVNEGAADMVSRFTK